MAKTQTTTVPVKSNSGTSNSAESGPRRQRIGELLVSDGYVQPGQIAEALEYQKRGGGKIVEILIKLGHLDAHQFARFITSQRGIPSIELANYQVPLELCTLIPRAYVVKHEVFPIDRLGKLLTVGMAFPLDSDTIDDLEKMTGLRVKALLINRADLERAIERYYPREMYGEVAPSTEEHIESAVKLHNVAQLVRELDQLPTLPQTVQRVQEATQNPNSSLREIAGMIALDPPVAAKLLRLANSAAYGFSNKIDSVERATTLLGLKETYMVVLSSAVLDLMERSKHFDIERFWRHSMLCALAAKGFAESRGEKRKGGVFAAGLLHDIGRFALSEVAPKQYAKIDAALTGDALIAAEQQQMAISHAEAGYLLADHWGLPPEISEPIRFHHAPELAKQAKDVVEMIAAAAAIAEAHTGEPLEADIFAERCAESLLKLHVPLSDGYRVYCSALESLDTPAA